MIPGGASGTFGGGVAVGWVGAHIQVAVSNSMHTRGGQGGMMPGHGNGYGNGSGGQGGYGPFGHQRGNGSNSRNGNGSSNG